MRPEPVGYRLAPPLLVAVGDGVGCGVGSSVGLGVASAVAARSLSWSVSAGSAPPWSAVGAGVALPRAFESVGFPDGSGLDGSALGVGDSEAVGLGVGDAVGEAEGVGLAEGEVVGDADGLGVVVGVGEAEGDGLAGRLGLGVGFGFDGVPCGAPPAGLTGAGAAWRTGADAADVAVTGAKPVAVAVILTLRRRPRSAAVGW